MPVSKKSKVVHITLTKEEANHLELLAKHEELTKTQYIKWILRQKWTLLINEGLKEEKR